MHSMRCLFAASEVAGFAKTGGLADVAGSCRGALAERGIDVAVIMPLYRCARHSQQPLEPTEHRFRRAPRRPHRRWPLVALDPARLRRARLPRSSSPTSSTATTPPRAAASISTRADRRQDATTPTTASASSSSAAPSSKRCRCSTSGPTSCTSTTGRPAWSRSTSRESTATSAKPTCAIATRRIRTLFTIHNIAYQGIFWHFDLPTLGLPGGCSTIDQLEFYGQLNFLKARHRLRRPAQHRQPDLRPGDPDAATSAAACRACSCSARDRLFGIVNGVDYARLGPGDRPAPRRQLRRRQALDRQAGVQGGAAAAVRAGRRAAHAAARHGRPAGGAEGARPDRGGRRRAS